MTPTIMLVLLAVTVVAGLVISKLIASGKARDTILPAVNDPAYDVALPCRVNGHAYGAFDTGWRCATCGNHISRREGESYGLVKDGRHERRRDAR